MRILYDIFFILFSLVYLPYLLIKGKFHKDFLQKFGFIPKDVLKLKFPIWIHAVSVGEANLAIKLSVALKEIMPDVPVIVSTTTQTGNDLVRKNKNRTIDEVFYYPIDISGIVQRVIKAINPRAYIIVETEIWPNIISQMHLAGVPVFIVNGRISDGSFKNYKRISVVTRMIFDSVDFFCMQSEQDSTRIRELGAASEKVFVTGNLKFDGDTLLLGSGSFNKEQLGFKESDNVIIAGSTHYPEEAMLIDMFERLKEKREDLKLIIAPRHIERNDALKIYCDKAGLKYVCFSDVLSGKTYKGEMPEIVLVDTIGNLKDLYELATVVFIGGTIADKGGQNPIEAAMWGKPVVFGPNMNNFRQISRFFLENNAACQVGDEMELEVRLEKIVDSRSCQRELSLNAKKVISDNTGAIAKTIKIIRKVLCL